MLPLVTSPWFLFGLAALPALAVLYWLRSRYRRVAVSSLMLWEDHKQPREGGLRFEKLQTPLLFFLELAALALLALAAAQPRVLSARGTRPLVVVLDDSFSMQAGGPESARERGLQALAQELRSRRHASVRFVLAGTTPQLLGDETQSPALALKRLEGWTCRSPTARIEEAAALAAEVSGPGARVLVLSDQAPVQPPQTGRVQWWSYGQPRGNLAIVNAVRSSSDTDRCLIEIANLSPGSRSTSLVVTAGDPPRELMRTPLSLASQEVRRVPLQLQGIVGTITAAIDADELEIDNRVTLLAHRPDPVRVELAVSDPALKALAEKALRAVKGAMVTANRPALRITDSDDARATDVDVWQATILAEKDAEAYLGPFVIDRGHPLTEGLDLNGVVWGAGKSERFSGVPVIMAGNIPLVTDAESLTGRHHVRIRLRPDLSTVQDSPGWPVLIWNLVEWRGGYLPGLRQANYRLGAEVSITVPDGINRIEITAPDGSRSTSQVHGRRAQVRGDQPGVYAILAGPSRYAIAVNALAREESDLEKAVSGQWGDWLSEEEIAASYQSMVWILILLTLAILAAHLLALRR